MHFCLEQDIRETWSQTCQTGFPLTMQAKRPGDSQHR